MCPDPAATGPQLTPQQRQSTQPDKPNAPDPTHGTNTTVENMTLQTSAGDPVESKKQTKKRHVRYRDRILTLGNKTLMQKREIGKEKQALRKRLQKYDTINMDAYPLGYPRQAAFQASKPSFSIYRAFGYLHARVILELQDELRCLEEELADLDYECLNSKDLRQQLRIRSRDIDKDEARLEQEAAAAAALKKTGNNQANNVNAQQVPHHPLEPPISKHAAKLAKIRVKLLEYDEMLVKARELTEFQTPTNRDYLTFRTWFWNKKPLSYELEEEYTRRRGDLITLRPRAEWGKFDGWIEAKMPNFLSRFFRAKEPHDIQPDPLDDKFTSYYSVARIEKFTTLIIAFVIIILLAVPVFVMYRVSWQGGRGMTFLNVGLLIVFSLFFSASMSLMTKAKRAELFAASAAYSAVLIVFIGNFAGKGDD